MPAIKIQKSVGLNAVNRAADVLAVKTRLIELGFDWLTADEVMGPTTVKAIKLFQAIKNGRNQVNIQGNDGRIDPGGDTLKWLNAENAPRWMQMPPGSPAEGFHNHELTQTNDAHDFGTSWLADTLKAAAASYKEEHLSANTNAALLTLNDFSLPQGGDTPMHATHESGLACDIRLPRKNGQTGGGVVGQNAYDRKAMRAMILAFRRQPLASRVLLSDQVLVAEGLCMAAQGHANHAHFEVKPPARIDPD
ncbi:MAG TPA: peptidoglycan-binding domain-containing protein [Pyrinomonadaceae bacterium]